MIDGPGRRVRVESLDGYREIWLTRPEKRNALDITMRDQLYETLLWILDDPTSPAVGLLAEGPDFCAGGDMNEFGSRADPAQAWQIRLIRSLPVVFAAVGPRLVVGIQGAAVGAGIELASFARVIVATPSSRFRLPEAWMGLIPGSGGTVSVLRRIGRRATFAMALTADWLSAPDAARLGLVDEIVDPAALAGTVRGRARSL